MTDVHGDVKHTRLLVVSRDARFAAELGARLPDLDVVALTDATTRHALRGGSPLLDDVGLVVLDGTVSGQVRLRLYDRLRPPGRECTAPVLFTRSGFAASRSEGVQGLDLYFPPESTVREIAWWCGGLLRLPRASAERRPGARTVGARSTVVGWNRLPAQAHTAPAAQLAVQSGGGRRPGYGWVAQAGLWGVAAALTALTFWPAAGRGAIGESIRGQVRALFGVQAVFATTPADAPAADVPALPGPSVPATRR